MLSKNKARKRRSRKAGLPPGSFVHVGEQKVDKSEVSLIVYDVETVWLISKEEVAVTARQLVVLILESLSSRVLEYLHLFHLHRQLLPERDEVVHPFLCLRLSLLGP